MTGKLAFMHIPKNGGTSLRSLLTSWYDEERICPYRQGEDYLRLFDEEQLQRWDFFSGHLPLYVAQRFFPRDMPKLTVLRHPVERGYSIYAYWRAFTLPEEVTDAPPGEIPALYEREFEGPRVAKELDFGSFLFSSNRYVRRALNNSQARFLSTGRLGSRIDHMSPGEALDALLLEIEEWNIHVEILENPERMSANLARLGEELGVTDCAPMPHENRSDRAPLDHLDKNLVADFLRMISPLDFLLYEHFANDHGV